LRVDLLELKMVFIKYETNIGINNENKLLVMEMAILRK
jgi:hypothetical protein